MRKLTWIAIMTATVAFPAVAQTPERGDGQDPPRRQRRADRQDAGQQGPRFDMAQMARRMAERLELTDEQQVKFDEIVALHQERARESGMGPDGWREQMRAMRDAEENGDTKRLEELREQMRAQRENMTKSFDAFFGDVEKILTPDQTERFAQMRQRFGQFGGPGGPDGMRRALETLPEDLALTDDQKPRYDELRAELQERQDEQRRAFRELRPLFEEMRAARESGDTARADELQQQIDEKRGGPDGMRQVYEKFFTDLEKILTPEQKAHLADLREQMGGGPGGPGGRDEQDRNATDTRTLIRAARRLELSDDQKKEFEAITEAAGKLQREARDKAGREHAFNTVKAQILEILTPEQKAEFEKSLQRGNRNARPQRGEGERPARRRAGDDAGDAKKGADEKP